MLASLTLLFTIVLLSIPGTLIYIPWAALTGDALPLYKSAMFIIRTAFRLGGIRVVATGLENVPPGTACIFMANHVSNLDPPALLPFIPGRTSAFLKRSLMHIPVLGWGFRLGGFIPVDRSGSAAQAQESVAAARRVLESGLHITTFVEGTRSHDGRMLPFKKGPFYLAMETGAPCIPVSLWGTESMMKKGSVRITPGVAHLVFHPPVYPDDYATRDDLLNAVRAVIASALPEWMHK
jgi:1-acyl-sn-glycerol-3-phosphate acyltransferase